MPRQRYNVATIYKDGIKIHSERCWNHDYWGEQLEKDYKDMYPNNKISMQLWEVNE